MIKNADIMTKIYIYCNKIDVHYLLYLVIKFLDVTFPLIKLLRYTSSRRKCKFLIVMYSTSSLSNCL